MRTGTETARTPKGIRCRAALIAAAAYEFLMINDLRTRCATLAQQLSVANNFIVFGLGTRKNSTQWASDPLVNERPGNSPVFPDGTCLNFVHSSA